MAVHFWPALAVISLTTSLAKISNSSSSGVTSGARMALLRKSASALKGMLLARTLGWLFSVSAVLAEPVKVTRSCSSSRSRRSPVPPMIS